MGLIRKTLQLLITATVLGCSSQAYRYGFALIEERFAPPTPISVARDDDEAGPATLSKSAQEARELAAKAFGENHWAAHKDLKIRFYDAQRGFWIYAQNYDAKSESGTVIRFWPIVFIWRGSADSEQPSNQQKLISGSGEEAVIEMSQPLGVIKPGQEAPKIVKASLRGNVAIRDDKATESLADDLEVGPLADIEFDEPSLTILSKSDVRIKDRDLLITGNGLRIELWPRELLPPDSQRQGESKSNQANFTGTKSIQLASRVRIEVANVGKSNILPGQARDQSQEIPAWLQCDGPMRIDLPRQSVAPKVGPPRPVEPTIATFTRNVQLQRGIQQPDQLSGDDLRAELFPTAKPVSEIQKPNPVKDSEKNKSGGTMTELDLKWAKVTGSKVVLKSQAQGLTTVGTELILKRPGDNRADEVYIRGTEQNPLLVERIEYARNANGTAGEEIRSIETMTARDITLFDEKAKPADSGTATKVASTAVDIATVVARGAGQIEVRNGRNQPVSRYATWTEQAVMITDGDGNQARKVITLSGQSKVWDGKSGRLESGKTLTIWLSPKIQNVTNSAQKSVLAAKPTDRRESQAGLSPSSYEIERVQALENVHLEADNRFLNASDRLDVEFLPGINPAPKGPSEIATKPDSRVKPTSFWADQPAAETIKPADNDSTKRNAVASAPGPERNSPQVQGAAKVQVDAKRIWARLGPATKAGNSESGTVTSGNQASQGNIELVEARLRGDVKFLQENADRARKPSEVIAQAVDIVHQGRGVYHLLAFSVDPNAKASDKPSNSMVQIRSEQFEIQGPILGLNQQDSTAWVNGPGEIKQWIGSEILKQQGFGSQDVKTGQSPRASGAAKPQIARISWKKRMDFLGMPVGREGQPVDARAHFQGKVEVRTEDAILLADELDTYFDKRIPLDQVQPGLSEGMTASNSRASDNTKPQISFVDAKRNVTILNRTWGEKKNEVADMYRAEGQHFMYDKSRDMAQVNGSGIVRIYQRREGNGPIQGINSNKTASKPDASKKPFNLTRVAFLKGMQGRLGFDPQAKDNQAKDRSADFFGNVQVLNGQVSSEFHDLNVDKPPAEFMLLSSEWLEVESLADAANPGNPRNLIRAKGNATARTANMSTQGDQIHFDSREELFHVIGLNGRDVTLVHQQRPGSPPSTARGKSLVYNNITGESQLVDPKSIQLIDSNSGIRPRFTPEKTDKVQDKPQRTPLQLPPSGDKERRSF